MFPSRSGHPRHSWKGGLRRQVILSGGNRCWQNLITKWPPSNHSPLPGCHNPDSIPFPAFHTGFSYLRLMDNFVGFVNVCSGLKIVLFPLNWQHIIYQDVWLDPDIRLDLVKTTEFVKRYNFLPILLLTYLTIGTISGIPSKP